MLVHLSQLESFGMPYFTPFVGADMNRNAHEEDSFVRPPSGLLERRPVYASEKDRARLRMREQKKL